MTPLRGTGGGDGGGGARRRRRCWTPAGSRRAPRRRAAVVPGSLPAGPPSPEHSSTIKPSFVVGVKGEEVKKEGGGGERGEYVWKREIPNLKRLPVRNLPVDGQTTMTAGLKNVGGD